MPSLLRFLFVKSKLYYIKYHLEKKGMSKICVAITLKNPINYIYLQVCSLFFPNGFYHNLDI